jgi:4-amino-4-deoxy-L-arabinose transferase-like glycosyltransferase
MDNEITQESWWKRNWKWFVSLLAFILASLILAYAITQGNFKDMAQAYNDTTLYTNAIDQANNNEEVIQILGEIGPLDNLAILEGSTKYSNNNKSVFATVRIRGKKKRGRMDIAAQKINSEWVYEMIKVRVEKSTQIIMVKE